MSRSSLVRELQNIPGVILKDGVLGSSLTNMRVGGSFSNFIQVESLPALRALLPLLRERGDSWRVLGAGSNILAPSAGVEEWVIKLGRDFNGWERSDGDKHPCISQWRCGAATSAMNASLKFTQQGWSGLEFAAGIPGSLGGLVAMNAGAHGDEIANHVVKVRAVDGTGHDIELNNSEMKFGYRRTIFTEKSEVHKIKQPPIIYAVVLEFTEEPPELLIERRSECLEYRKKTQPLTLPSSGSVFANPSKEMSAGFLIESVGLKGFVCGGAQISEQHANWIVNPNKAATSDDVRSLIKVCQEQVLEVFGINLEPEIRLW